MRMEKQLLVLRFLRQPLYLSINNSYSWVDAKWMKIPESRENPKKIPLISNRGSRRCARPRHEIENANRVFHVAFV